MKKERMKTPSGWKCVPCHGRYKDREEYITHMAEQHGKVCLPSCHRPRCVLMFPFVHEIFKEGRCRILFITILGLSVSALLFLTFFFTHQDPCDSTLLFFLLLCFADYEEVSV